MMFNELPFLQRFAAADAGFTGVEYLFPYEFPPELIAAELTANALENVLFNLPPGDWASGERSTTCLPGREEEFRVGVATAIRYAKELKTTRLHATAGIVPQGVTLTDAKTTYVANFAFAAAELAKHGIQTPADRVNLMRPFG